MQQFTSRLFTGTHSRIVLGLIAPMLMTLLIYGSASRNVQAAGTGFTQTQTYSSNFSMKNLTTDGTTQMILMKIPFAVPSKGKVEVTAIFSLVVFNPTNRVTSCVGCNAGTLNCSVSLDGAPITSLSDVYYSYNIVSQEYAMTTTSAVIAGTHTIALLCVGLLNPNYTNLVMQATGRGMSAIVLY
jgi:hypothetical protein